MSERRRNGRPAAPRRREWTERELLEGRIRDLAREARLHSFRAGRLEWRLAYADRQLRVWRERAERAEAALARAGAAIDAEREAEDASEGDRGGERRG